MSYIDEKKIALLVVAYPEISGEDRLWIDQFRKEHDQLFFNVVKPHFTFVFPTFGFDAEDFESEVLDRLKGIQKFDFTLRSAMISNDQLSEYYHIFLVPDEGNSNFIKLHDRLYSGMFLKNLNLDIDFIPHMGIGAYKSVDRCKTQVDLVNLSGIEIKGRISSVDIISYGDRKVENICQIELKD